MLETRSFDPAEHIRDREEAGFYMDAALSHGDLEDVVDALNVIARALGEPEPGLPSNAGLVTVGRAMRALGLRLAATQVVAAVAA